MYKYIPIVKSSTVGDGLLNLIKSSETVKHSIIPYVEIGHKKVQDDIANLNRFIGMYDYFFVDYAYFRQPSLANNDSKWSISPNMNTVKIISDWIGNGEISGYSNSVLAKRLVPIASRPKKTPDSVDVEEHYKNLIETFKDRGYSRVGLRISHSYLKKTNLEWSVDVLQMLNNKDFVFIDNRNTIVESNSFKKYEDSINRAINFVRDYNREVNIVISNPDFELKDSPDDRIYSHNHGGTLMSTNNVFGYSNYMTDPERDPNGGSTLIYTIYYYNFKTGDTMKFSSDYSYKDALEIMRNDEQAVSLVKEHSSHCGTCREFLEMLKDTDKGGKKLKNNKKRGDLKRNHFINSIVVDEMSQGLPSSY